MATLFNVSDWNEKSYFNTGGTREKSLLESPEGDNFYFKTSLSKPNKDYKFEFWSEIVASEIGNFLGLNVLKYDVAIKGEIIGCISQSMINSEKEKLVEGVNYLIGYNNSYDPSSKKDQPLYSYQYIKEALEFFRLGIFIPNIDEIIVFDALIGNGDRHQENWGVISKHGIMSKPVLDTNVYQTKNYLVDNLKSIYKNLIKRNYNFSDDVPSLVNIITGDTRFSPIYDSGSSLAREHNDEKLAIILKENTQFDAYVNRGKSEIHWEGYKLSHFDLVKKLITESQKATDTIKMIESKFSEASIGNIINNIDQHVPLKFSGSKLSPIRKEFLTKLVTSRYKKLISLL